jgi:hypothetical protein
MRTYLYTLSRPALAKSFTALLQPLFGPSFTLLPEVAGGGRANRGWVSVDHDMILQTCITPSRFCLAFARTYIPFKDDFCRSYDILLLSLICKWTAGLVRGLALTVANPHTPKRQLYKFPTGINIRKHLLMVPGASRT